jgi:hypothetical protein
VIFGENTSGKLQHCRVLHHELSGVQARVGASLLLHDCEVLSNGGKLQIASCLSSPRNSYVAYSFATTSLGKDLKIVSKQLHKIFVKFRRWDFKTSKQC